MSSFAVAQNEPETEIVGPGYGIYTTQQGNGDYYVDENEVDFDINGTPVNPYVISSYLYQLDDQAGWTDNNGSTVVNLQNLSEGVHAFRAKVVDSMGVSDLTPPEVTFFVDTVRPTPRIDSGPNGWIDEKSVAFNFSGIDPFPGSEGLKYSYRLDSADWVAYSNTTSATFSNLAEGLHTFWLAVMDAAGNESFIYRDFVVKDKTPPETKIISGPASTISTKTTEFEYGGSDNLTETSDLIYQYRINGDKWQAFTYATKLILEKLLPGQYVFEVQARDQSGNIDPTPAKHVFKVIVQISSDRLFIILSGKKTINKGRQNLLLTGQLTDIYGKAMQNKRIAIKALAHKKIKKKIKGKKGKFKLVNKRWWMILGYTVTDNNGTFNFKHKPKLSTTYQAEFDGDNEYKKTSSNLLKASVKSMKKKRK